MGAENLSAILKHLKLINQSVEIMDSRIEILEKEIKYANNRNKFFKVLMHAYPFFIGCALVMVGADQHKITEIKQDIHELIQDTRDLTRNNAHYPDINNS